MSTSDNTGTEKNKDFTNKIRRGETLTVGTAYVNSIKPVRKGDKELWFASLGLQCGWQPGETEGQPVPVYQNVDVLVGRSLVKTLSLFAGEYTKDTGKPYGTVQIRNLVFKAEDGADKTFLNTRGILETITFGHLDD